MPNKGQIFDSKIFDNEIEKFEIEFDKIESKILIRTGRMTSIQSFINLIGPLTGKGILLASELRLEITEN